MRLWLAKKLLPKGYWVVKIKPDANEPNITGPAQPAE